MLQSGHPYAGRVTEVRVTPTLADSAVRDTTASGAALVIHDTRLRVWFP